MRNRLLRRATLVAGVVVTSLVIGTIGFQLIEGYSAFDAFYMTLITISTVGYRELTPLSETGRIFNSFLILFGVGSMFLAVGVITQTVIEFEIEDHFGKRRRKRVIESLHNHVIVCGYGRVGRNASMQLKRAGADVLVVDRNEDRVESAMQAGLLAVEADATRDAALLEAGVKRARGLVSALASDADNLFIILSAKTLNPALTVVTRAAEEEAEQKLRRAGADTVLAPYSMTGYQLAESLLRPHVQSFVEVAMQGMGLNVRIEQLLVGKGTEFAHKNLRDMQVRRELGVIVLAVKRATGEMVFNPPADMEIVPGDFLIAMGEPVNLDTLERMLDSTRPA
jgi:voltage-gated potassium channel